MSRRRHREKMTVQSHMWLMTDIESAAFIAIVALMVAMALV